MVEQDLLPELEAYLEGPPQAPWDSIQEMTRVLGLLQWSCGEIKRERAWRKGLRSITALQADDEGLWFDAQTAPEGYLQLKLRVLHGLIEEGVEL